MVYYNESGDESDAPPRLLLDKIEKGDLGVKSGRGFYTYPQPAFQESFLVERWQGIVGGMENDEQSLCRCVENCFARAQNRGW